MPEVACVASVSVWFRSKERPKNNKERDFRFSPREEWNESQTMQGGGGEWKIRSLKEVEQEVIITNNNLLLHFSGHNNDRVVLTMERSVESHNALAPRPS